METLYYREEQVRLRPSEDLIVKAGSNLIVNPDGSVNTENLVIIASQIAALRQEGKRSKIVTSGAVARGKNYITGYDGSDEMRRMAAIVGQQDIMKAWKEVFSQYDLEVSEWLVTDRDLFDPHFIQALHEAAATTIPIINGHDAINPQCAYVSNNDNLAAGLALATDSTDTVLLCTNTPGVLDRYGRVVDFIEPHKDYTDIEFSGKSTHGTGGMADKHRAALSVAERGKRAVICGLGTDVILEAAQGYGVGTTYIPQ